MWLFFHQGNNPKVHMKTHSLERPFKSGQCEHSTKQELQLEIHMRTHNGKKTIVFPNQVVGKNIPQQHTHELWISKRSFAQPRLHNCKTAISHSAEFQVWKKHNCFYSREELKKCEFCVKSFTKGVLLKKHMILHTNAGQKKHKCTQCEYSTNLPLWWNVLYNVAQRHKNLKLSG